MKTGHALLIAACVFAAGAPVAASAFWVMFDDPVASGETVYTPSHPGMHFHDLSGSGFGSMGPGAGQRFIHEPGLEGGVRPRDGLPYDAVEIFIQFDNHGVGNLGFDFAVYSGSFYVENAVRFTVYDDFWNIMADTFSSAMHFGGPFPENRVFVTFNGVARYAEINFRDDPNPGEEFNRYIIDNFVSVPEPLAWTQMIAGFGLIGVWVRLRQRRIVTAS